MEKTIYFERWVVSNDLGEFKILDGNQLYFDNLIGWKQVKLLELYSLEVLVNEQ